jgi:hypothetical protein
MKYKALFTALLLPSLGQYALAATNSIAVPTPQQQVQINNLQNQINQLQATAENSPSNNKFFNKMGNIIMLDTANPFGLMPDINFSLAVIQGKQKQLTKPVVVGGYIEADAQAWGGSLNIPSSNYQSGSNLYITNAKLYAMGNVNNWVTTFFSLQPSTNNASGTTFDQAFMVIGNLNSNPLFLTIGETYLPFGSFAGNGPWSNSITTNDFRISQTDQINLGYYQNGLTLNLAVANGANNTNNNSTYSQNLEDFVYNANYIKSYSNSFNYSVGASYLSDIRGQSPNIGGAYNSTLTGGKNAAYDLNGSIGYKQVTLNAEFASTTKSANFNGVSTGRLSSWMTTLSYAPVLYNQITTFSVGYSTSKNANNVPYTVSGMYNNLPATGTNQGFKQQWIAFVQRPIINNVYLGPEYDYAKTYNNQNTWTATLDLSAYF